MVFPVIMYGCESWTVKKAECRRIDAFELWCWRKKTLESPLDCKEIQPVHSEGDQPCDFFGRNDAKAETPVLWPPHAERWLIGKDSDAGRDWGQEEKGTTEDEMAGWHHWLNVNESQWTPGVGDGQRGMVCYVSWGCKESDTTEWLIWSDAKAMAVLLLFFIQQLRVSYASDLLWKIKWDRFRCRCVLEACSGTLSWISASFWYQILETEFLQKLTGECPSDYEWSFWIIRKHDWGFADRILNFHLWYTE